MDACGNDDMQDHHIRYAGERTPRSCNELRASSSESKQSIVTTLYLANNCDVLVAKQDKRHASLFRTTEETTERERARLFRFKFVYVQGNQ